MKRRDLLIRGAGLTALGGFGALFSRSSRGSALRTHPRWTRGGPVDLAPGLRVKVLQQVGEPMSDGVPVPALPDGMGLFVRDGRYVLMRNHELPSGTNGPLADGRFPSAAYRPGGRSPDGTGGVSRLVVSAETLEPLSSNGVLTGTVRNCSGGVSPWGWLSCEENTSPDHGYVFLAPADAEGWCPAEPIRGYGRFNHEAVAVTESGVAYLTEDRGDSCLYRFVPSDPAKPFQGRLQAMRVPGAPGFDTARSMPLGHKVAVDWVDLDEPEAPKDDLRHRARALGAARVCRGEGIAAHRGAVYFTATTGGPVGRGQVFELKGDGLRVVAHSQDPADLDCPDNLTVAPWGDLIVAEDGYGQPFIRGIRPDGTVYDIARNAISHGEFAGVCVSPDGRTLFANLQKDGLTIAIHGNLQEVGHG